MSTTETKKVAYLTSDTNGWFWCDDESDTIDARGPHYPTKREALVWLRENARQASEHGLPAYTHYRTGNGPARRI